MCGRFAMFMPAKEILGEFNIKKIIHNYTPNYNVAPTQKIPVIVGEVLDSYTWGFIPSFAKDDKLAPINARAETVGSKSFYKSAFLKQRCLIISNGFYEWKNKTPYYISLKKRKVFAFAGIYGEYNGVRNCAIIVTKASASMNGVHTRMPVILKKKNQSKWLKDSPVSTIGDCIFDLDDNFKMHQVSQSVGNVRNNGPKLIETIGQKTLV